MTSLTSPGSDTLVFRPAAERFHSRLDWLDSWHSFSFSNHYDPAWMGFGPLRVINDDTIAAGKGFGLHPHRDMEIVTVMVEGQLNHRDSMGHTAVLREGEVQVMSAGTGVVHSEMNLGERPCRLLQIWIEPARRALPPAYGQKSFRIGAGWTPLLTPDAAGDTLAIQRPVQLWRARPRPGDALEAAIGPGSQGWLQLIDGRGEIAGRPLQRGDGIGFEAGALPPFVAGPEGADLLLFALR
ncbi:pirin-like bicupin family protein [Cyanobium sp. NIES-981]|uniref:pirin family protein n=1 Tax=Cyanobium sp. NIES-981 TaxID=1851505 RepID=UPI0007DD7770|nr:pirin-like bicupin family protein [Cyanobium sp. NIES-981]SBO41884.1 putative Quercetin 2,3-dioxygenase [Cyanobium sp. NIES-981]